MRGAAEGFFAVVADRAGRIDQLFDESIRLRPALNRIHECQNITVETE
jgi:hypothetical protein